MKKEKITEKRLRKKAYFLSLDALLTLVLVFFVIILINPSERQYSPTNDMLLQKDILVVLSSLKIGEINNSYAEQLKTDGKIKNMNISILEQIGEFYAKGMPEAKNLTENILQELNPGENIGIWFNNQLIASVNSSSINNSQEVKISNQIISGIAQGGNVTGFSSRAFLAKGNKVKYFYFGGYVGDGNISVEIDYTGELKNVEIEAAFGDEFDLYINGYYINHYSPASSIIPEEISLIESLGNFSQGINTVEFKGNLDNLYIAGGHIKISYENPNSYESVKKYYFPGIDGVINLYDGFYVPGNLTNLEISLHLDTNYSAFLTIGNTTVYNGSTNGEETETITNSELSSLLNYNQLGKKTIPLRLGLENISYVAELKRNVDVFSVSDNSGSMQECVLNCSGGIPIKMINLSQQANMDFVRDILNITGNRIGLVGFESVAKDEDYHHISSDNSSLFNVILGWKPGGGTCTCCGINKAIQGFISGSNSSMIKVMVVMSDGKANTKCLEQNTGSATQDAIQAACEAYQNHNITVHTVGFGDNTDESTLQSMASCGNGSYYYSSVDELSKIYREIARDIIRALYVEQKVEFAGELDTRLYPDSFIKFNYIEEGTPYGLALTLEEQFNDSYTGNFNIPNDSEVLETKAVSYSGSKWTDKVEIYNFSSLNWGPVFNLSIYNLNYTMLGDPYVIDIPREKINKGNNTVRVTTGLSSQNSSPGSDYNKIIYTIIKEMSSYSEILASASGCNWNIRFESGENETIKVPANYSGSEECFFYPENTAYNNNDAINVAIYNLLLKLDLNSNKKIDVEFSDQDIEISSIELAGIPYTWDTEVQARTWR